MDWLVVNPHFHGTFANLGSQIGDTYKVDKDCLATLCDILGKLTIEDRTLRTYRRAMGFAQVVKKDLLPLLIGVRDDTKITDVTIKILLNLTVPVECLLPMDVMLKTDAGRYTVMELSMLLSTSKEAFVPPQSTRAVVDHMKMILDRESKLSAGDCESISNCLVLLRNILHIPEHCSSGNSVSMQNRILWNLFAQNVDKVLIELMTSQYREFWGVTVVQLIALMFKDQQVGTLQKLLNLWFESSLSDSSEGNESNTSPKHQASGDSSSMMTSDPTSDSSDNGGSNKKRSLYQTGEIKSINNESDDSQSSEPGSSIMSTSLEMSVNQGGPSNSEHQLQPQTRVCHSSKVRVKNLSELQARPRRSDIHITDAYMDTNNNSHSSMGSSQCSSWSRHKHNHVVSNQSSTRQNHEAQHIIGKELSGKGHQLHPKSYGSHSSNTPLKTLVKKTDNCSEMSDCGYGTQQENQESNSTSSNEDYTPHRCLKHQKPQHMLQKSRYNGKPQITPQERKELHRKKLVKRSHTNTMHMKALLHHSPSDDDVSNLLKEFTVDFLLRGYGSLVDVLLHRFLDGSPVQMDTSHFFWLVTYFLKFATQLELDLDHISSVLTIEVVSYLTSEGVNLYEELQIGIKSACQDLKPCLRRMHLVITSIREFIQAVEAYKKLTHLTEEDQNHLLKLQLQIVEVRDLRGLFVLLLRQFNPSLQSQQFLQDLIVTNHNLLSFIENASKLPQCQSKANIIEHLKQFGTSKVMFNYGLLLENFVKNGEFVNDCILTMMHHVAGDLSQVHVLFQPSILQCLSCIGEADYEICDDWSDLIEYVIHKFMKNQSRPESKSANVSDHQQVLPNIEDNKTEWMKEDCNSLYWYYQQSCESTDPIGSIVDMFKKSGVPGKTRVEVIQQLFLQDIINDQLYRSFMEVEASLVMMKERNPSASVAANSTSSSPLKYETCMERIVSKETEQPDDIKALKGKLIREGFGNVVQWLQELLLELCYVKLYLRHDFTAVMEPIPYICTRLNQSTPLVPWYIEQEHSLLSPTFILLLHKLGFHLADDSAKIFPRIPHFWTPDILFKTAENLGPVTQENTKFNIHLVKSDVFQKEITKQMDTTSTSTGAGCQKNEFRIPIAIPRPSLSLNKSTPIPIVSSVPNWLQIVQKSKFEASVPLPIAGDQSTSSSRSGLKSFDTSNENGNTKNTSGLSLNSRSQSFKSLLPEAVHEEHSLSSSAMDVVNEPSQISVLQQDFMSANNSEISSSDMDTSQT